MTKPLLTTTRSTTAPGQRPSPLSMAVERLLDPETGHELWQGRGTIAVVRGFDKDSRRFHRTVLQAAATHGWSVTGVPAAPAFGSIPAHTDVRLVVAARTSLRPVAERCAAHWGAHVICPETIGGADWHTTPAAALTLHSGGAGSDSIASSLHITGQVRYTDGDGSEATATALVVEPCEAGALVTAESGSGARTPHVTDGQLGITLDEPARATLDGHPQLLPEGDYTVTPRPAAFRHLVAADATAA